jgi:hypothetical protein
LAPDILGESIPLLVTVILPFETVVVSRFSKTAKFVPDPSAAVLLLNVTFDVTDV